ncbi:hypothetical protein NQ318_017422 [Aromia moschata]|uniref:Helix-turn-helix domain-containing protein n=1 Tax=Aromia moschata TaxID=1265417 RepID=A0AAV8Z4I3_9CUCU|nr:hypothetical protein NQ318_017422 [Aromia moschata]
MNENEFMASPTPVLLPLGPSAGQAHVPSCGSVEVRDDRDSTNSSVGREYHQKVFLRPAGQVFTDPHVFFPVEYNERETHPDLPPLNQGTISKIEAEYREMGHVRKVPSKRQAVVDDYTKLNLLLALEENPITPALFRRECFEKFNEKISRTNYVQLPVGRHRSSQGLTTEGDKKDQTSTTSAASITRLQEIKDWTATELHEHHPSDPDCITRLLDGQPSTCPVIPYLQQDDIIEEIAEGSIILIPKDPLLTQMNCKVSEHQEIKVPTLVQVPVGCSISVHHQTYLNEQNTLYSRPMETIHLETTSYTDARNSSALMTPPRLTKLTRIHDELSHIRIDNLKQVPRQEPTSSNVFAVNVLHLAISTPLHTTFPLLKAVLEVRFCQLVQNFHRLSSELRVGKVSPDTVLFKVVASRSQRAGSSISSVIGHTSYNRADRLRLLLDTTGKNPSGYSQQMRIELIDAPGNEIRIYPGDIFLCTKKKRKTYEVLENKLTDDEDKTVQPKKKNISLAGRSEIHRTPHSVIMTSAKEELEKKEENKKMKNKAETICDDESRPEELKQIKEALTKNGYKEKDIDRVCRTQNTKVEQQPTTYACLPYVSAVTDKLKKTLSKKNIGVRFRTVKKIQQVLPSNKDPVPRLLTKGVYELKCTCGRSYIGQTGRSIQCKSLEIMKNNNNFNREDGYRLSNTWRLAIPRTSDLECYGQPSSTDVQPTIAEPRYIPKSKRRQHQSLETF